MEYYVPQILNIDVFLSIMDIYEFLGSRAQFLRAYILVKARIEPIYPLRHLNILMVHGLPQYRNHHRPAKTLATHIVGQQCLLFIACLLLFELTFWGIEHSVKIPSPILHVPFPSI